MEKKCAGCGSANIAVIDHNLDVMTNPADLFYCAECWGDNPHRRVSEGGFLPLGTVMWEPV